MIARNNKAPVRANRERIPRTPHQDAVFGSAIFRGPVKTKTIVPLLILHLLKKGPEHGYGLMERIAAMTGDVMPVNSNTMYPLLRRLEERGFIAGEWEHPDRRSRRTYSITRAGAERYAQIKVRTRPHLDQLIVAVNRLRRAVFGARDRA
jgi:DNA-binding PadR family transcriptional regulator